MKLFKKAYYEKLMMQSPKTVQDYYLIVANAQKKIKELQEQCKHQDTKLMFYSYRVGSMTPYHVCNSCNFPVKPANEDEAKDFWENYNKKLGIPTNNTIY